MAIDFPTTPVQPVIVDPVCNNIAEFLKAQLNELSLKAHGWKLINTIRDYDDDNVPLGDYPVLAVYRNERGDRYSYETQFINVPITIKYSAVLKKDYKQAASLQQIGKYIHNYVSKVDNIFIDFNTPAIGYLRVTSRYNENVGNYTYIFGIIDSSVPDSLVPYLT